MAPPDSSADPASQHLHWWQRGVVYQVYPRSFQDRNGDGIGDLQGVIDRLDYLNDGTPRSLGVDAIWLSPFFPSPMADFGYDVSDYCNVDPMFGDLATFDRLVVAAHARGIKVVIDYVGNHTSDRHPWFVESRKSRTNPKRDWYIWRDAKPDGSLPNNWGSYMGGPAWTWDEGTGQYYLHQFVTEQPELNWRHPEVHRAMLDVLRFWLDRGVDGFRMDVIALIIKDAELRDNPTKPHDDPNAPLNDVRGRLVNEFNEDRPELHEIYREIRALLDSYGDRCAIGEIEAYPLARWVRYYGENGDGLHLPFNFRLIREPWTAAGVRRSVEDLEAVLPSFGWPNYVLGNHDVPRLATRLGVGQARIAAMLLLTLRGTPTLYQGDELGTEDGILPAHQLRDPQALILGPTFGRDPCRTPMQWDDTPFAGFSRSEPWLPVSADYKQRNVASQATEPTSMFNLYRRLLWLRRAMPALTAGSFRSVSVTDDECFVYLREAAGVTLIVALSFWARPRTLDLSSIAARGTVMVSTFLDREEPVDLAHLTLRGDEGLLVRVDRS